MWITRVAVANPVFATMLMAGLCVLGLFSMARLPVEPLPDVGLPVALVEVAWPGASPEAVERELSRPIEQALNRIAGLRRISSRSFEGRSQTNLEFRLDADMARVMQELRDRLGVVQAAFPKDAKPASIARYDNENARPVMTLALLSDRLAPRELSRLAEQTVARRLQRSEGVAEVALGGLQPRELRIELDPQRLRQHALTPAEIAAALRAANADEPVGLLSDRAQDALLRVEGRVQDPRAFADVVVARRGPLVLRLADVGVLVDREREPEAIARVDGRPAVTLDVFRQQDANIVATGRALRQAVEETRGRLPPGVELRELAAAHDAVAAQLAGVRHTLLEGAALTVAIVFLFLHSWRSTVITALALPIAVIASFIAVKALGFTLNLMTMMALSLSIGLLIDDAIVVRENIVRHLGLGRDHRRAALAGTAEIGLAVTATTLAICAVFVPVAFMDGLVGRFLHPFGVTVAVAVLVSLFVAFTLDPMLSAVWPDPPGAGPRGWPVVGAAMRATDRAMAALQAAYARLIGWLFGPWRRFGLRPRGVVGLAAVAAFVGALALLPAVGTEFLPAQDEGVTQLGVRLPVGASLARSDAKLRQVEALLHAIPEVRSVATVIGGPATGTSVGRNQATLRIVLVPRAQRQRTQQQVEAAIRAVLKDVPGIETTVGFDRPIYVAILGDDAALLGHVARDFAAALQKIPGVVDVELSARPGLPAHAVRLRPDAVRELGLTVPQLASSLRAFVGGEVATHWTAPDGEQVELLLRLPQAQRERVAQLRTLPVAFAADGTPIPLERVADVVPVANPDIIRRQDLQRREAVFAGVQGRPAGDVGDEVRALIARTALPPGVRFDLGGASAEQQEAFAALLGAMGLAVVFVYLVLASQFASFVQPLAIMASLPLALVGVVPALLATGSTLNLFSMIGLVMLMGLVTKNAILLVDHANRALRGGASVEQALREAGATRLRPIVMTTAAMVVGMLPLAVGAGDGGELQAPMGRAIIGGVLGSALLTLVVVPVAWSLLVRPRPAGAGGGVPAARLQPADPR